MPVMLPRDEQPTYHGSWMCVRRCHCRKPGRLRRGSHWIVQIRSAVAAPVVTIDENAAENRKPDIAISFTS